MRNTLLRATLGLLAAMLLGLGFGSIPNADAQTGSTAQGDPLEIHGPATVYIGPPPSTTVAQPPYQYYATGGTGSGYTFSVTAFTNLASINAQSGILMPNKVGSVRAIVRDSAGNTAYMTVTITSPWQTWENQYFNGANVDPNADPDGDGLTDLQEYRQGTNPTDYYNGVAPGLQITSGNNQYEVRGGVLTQALTVLVTKGNSTAQAANAPVTYQVTSSSGLVAASSAGPWAQTCAVRADANGYASVYFQVAAGALGPLVSSIQVNAGNAPAVVFNENTLTAQPVVTGLYHTVAVDGNGAVWTWGGGQYGQLGNGTMGDRSFADQVPTLTTNVVGVAAGIYHSLALRNDGTVYAWGSNSNGQLGDGTTTLRLAPVPVLAQTASGGTTPLSGVVAIAAGSYHSLALRNDGSVWAWGNNSNGQVGDGTSNNQRTAAVQVLGPGGTGTTFAGAVAITAGDAHSVALKSDGTVWAWGSNSSRQLGSDTGSNSYSYTPIQVAGVSGANYLTGITAIASGVQAYHTLAIKNDGTLYAWGYNRDGQIGNNVDDQTPNYPVQVVGIGTPHSNPSTTSLGTLSNVVSIAAGQNHSLAVLGDGRVCAWGDASVGQLGTNTTGDVSGDSDYPEVVVSTSGSGTLTGIASVSAGGNHSLAVMANGALYSWGTDTFGEGGNSTEAAAQMFPATVVGLSFAPQAARPTFVPEGGAYLAPQTVTVACASAGSLIYYTLDGSSPTANSLSVASGGTIGVNATSTLRAVAFIGGAQASKEKSALYQVGFARTAAGLYHTLAFDSSGYVWAWGYNQYGQLGNNQSGTAGGTPNQVVGTNGTGYLTNVVGVAAGIYHSLALRNDGTVYAWGSNSNGQLGDGTTTLRLAPVPVLAQTASGGTTPLSGVVAIAAGSYHSLALRNDGSVWAWGNNSNGQVGDGTSNNQRTAAVQVLGPGGTGTTFAGAVAITAGDAHSVALKSDGTVWAWGSNSSRQLGNGPNISFGVTPSEVSNAYGIVAVASGVQANHTLAIKSDGTLFAWGSNYDGQIGNNNEQTPSYPVQVLGIGTPNSQPSTASLGTLSGVVSVAAGQDHSLAVLSNGRVCAWGNATTGQLGNNTAGNGNQDSDYPEVVVSTSGSGTLTDIASVSAGGNHSVAVMNYQGVPLFLGWGSDAEGEVEGAAPATGPGQIAVTMRAYPVLVHVGADADHDGLADWQEFLAGTNPLNPDSNGDGILDGVAVEAGLNPLAPPPTLPPPNPNDHTPPTITITFPTVGITQIN